MTGRQTSDPNRALMRSTSERHDVAIRHGDRVPVATGSGVRGIGAPRHGGHSGDLLEGLEPPKDVLRRLEAIHAQDQPLIGLRARPMLRRTATAAGSIAAARS